MDVYLGIDVGSVSTKAALLDRDGAIIDAVYLRTQGRPIAAIQEALIRVKKGKPIDIIGVGTTGSARELAAVIVGADVVKNEITAHAVAAMHLIPDVKTVIEIGGQDSKLIIIRSGVVADFAMNTVCAAGTGSFLDQQAARLNIPIEDFGKEALASTAPVRVAGRCAVFAESDMIHKQQSGHQLGDILNGLCQALVRNYLTNIGKGKCISSPVVFQGGVAANQAMKRSFEEALGCSVLVPEYFQVMGAIGAGLLAKETAGKTKTGFRGFELTAADYRTGSFECQDCANGCEVVETKLEENVLARWGDRCGKWSKKPGR
ncbi:MAG: CoA-substrate-specific enzyme activase [Firmicutes bacterium]|nr:CoA-substrate-specific enzyme activase [Bacillota bacterium]